MFQQVLFLFILQTSLLVGECGRYLAPSGSHVSFPYRRVPTISELIEDAGFQHDRFNVTTEDGHILALHRVSPANADQSRGVPVLMINGYSVDSDGWLLLGNHSLPFILANMGYDVWLGDVRGCRRSLGHVRFTPEDARSYNYSIHELGLYDLPALIDHILETTKRQQILYVGMSLSSGILFVMNSERPEYNRKLLGAALMAPAGHLLKFEDNDLLYRINMFNAFHLVGSLRSGLWLYPRARDLPQAKQAITYCHLPALYLQCRMFALSVFGFSDSFDSDTLFYQIATGFTTQHMNIGKHLIQMIMLGRFCKYDYGFERNLEVYGHEYPPNYNFSRTTSPVFIINGGRDLQVRPKAAQRTGRQLGNLSKRKFVASFNHADFLLGKNAPKMVYADIVDFFYNLAANITDDGSNEPKPDD